MEPGGPACLFEPSLNDCFTDSSWYRLNQNYNELDTCAIIFGIVYPILVFVTGIANVFVVLVLSKKHMSSPTNTVLLYMATADLCLAVVPLPFAVFYFMLGHYRSQDQLQSWWCQLRLLSNDELPPLFHNIAIWLTVLLAAQRFIYINYPLAAQHWCTLDNVRRASIVIVIGSVIASLPKLLMNGGFHTVTHGSVMLIPLENSSYMVEPVREAICLIIPSRFTLAVGEDEINSFYYSARVVLFILIPSVALVILNCLLILGIHRAKVRKQRLLLDRKRPDSSGKQSANTSVMLVIVVTIFLIVNLPQGIVLSSLCFTNWFDLPQVEWSQSTLFWVVTVDNLLILATYPINFAIYCSMGAQFRETFKNLFCSANTPLISYTRRLSSYYTPVGDRVATNGRSCKDTTDNL